MKEISGQKMISAANEAYAHIVEIEKTYGWDSKTSIAALSVAAGDRLRRYVCDDKQYADSLHSGFEKNLNIEEIKELFQESINQGFVTLSLLTIANTFKLIKNDTATVRDFKAFINQSNDDVLNADIIHDNNENSKEYEWQKEEDVFDVDQSIILFRGDAEDTDNININFSKQRSDNHVEKFIELKLLIKSGEAPQEYVAGSTGYLLNSIKNKFTDFLGEFENQRDISFWIATVCAMLIFKLIKEKTTSFQEVFSEAVTGICFGMCGISDYESGI